VTVTDVPSRVIEPLETLGRGAAAADGTNVSTLAVRITIADATAMIEFDPANCALRMPAPM
jgi:hypothetical protein